MSDYTENINRIVGVGWSGASFVVSVINIGFNNYLEFQEVDEEGSPVDNDGTPFQGVLTGADSGATVDLALLPIWTLLGASYLVDGLTCTWGATGFYRIPSGEASQGSDAPTIAGYIVVNAFEKGLARVFSIRGTNGNPLDCKILDNGPALPAFINGETVTVSYPEEE